MVVCKFWLQGNCRFGDSCRFEHPIANQNRFGAFGSPSGGGSSSAAATTASTTTTAASSAAANPYNVTPAGIVKDLTEDRPSWIFSAYGPGRNAPAQLFGGAQTEQSFEELRLHYYKATAAGNPQAAVNDIDTLYRQAQQQMEMAVKSPDAAARFVLQAEQQHPNRLDQCTSNSISPTPGAFDEGRPRGSQPQQQQQTMGGLGGFGAPTQPAAANPFGQPSTTTPATANPFGAPSTTPAFGAKPAFGQPAGGSTFGQPTQLGGGGGGGGNAFGQPSALGGGGGGAFGQPSQLGGTTSAFAKPAQPAFGQPSQPASTTPAFSQPAQPSAFGQPSQPAATTSAFGQPSQLGGGGGASAFGQPSALGQKPGGFGTPSTLGSGGGGFSKFAATGTGGSAFGQPSQPGPAAPGGGAALAAGGFGGASAFGRPSGLGLSPSPFVVATTTNNASPSPFGAAATTTSPSQFGQPSGVAASPSPFGQPSGGAAAASANPFGQPASTSPAPANPFGQPSQPAAAAASANPFAAAATTTTTMTASPSPFSQPSGGGFQQAGQTPSPFNQPSSIVSFGSAGTANSLSGTTASVISQTNGPNATSQHPPLDSYAQRDAVSGRLLAFKGRRVVYEMSKDSADNSVETPTIQRPSDGKPAKIWFPNGPPPYNEDTEMQPRSIYTGPDSTVQAQYQNFMNTGRFAVGMMPETPPLREWCLWNF